MVAVVVIIAHHITSCWIETDSYPKHNDYSSIRHFLKPIRIDLSFEVVLNIFSILNCKFNGNEIGKETIYFVHIVRPWWCFIIIQYDDDKSTGQ